LSLDFNPREGFISKTRIVSITIKDPEWRELEHLLIKMEVIMGFETTLHYQKAQVVMVKTFHIVLLLLRVDSRAFEGMSQVIPRIYYNFSLSSLSTYHFILLPIFLLHFSFRLSRTDFLDKIPSKWMFP